MCEFQIRFTLLWIRRNLAKPSFTEKGSQLKTNIQVVKCCRNHLDKPVLLAVNSPLLTRPWVSSQIGELRDIKDGKMAWRRKR